MIRCGFVRTIDGFWINLKSIDKLNVHEVGDKFAVFAIDETKKIRYTISYEYDRSHDAFTKLDEIMGY